MSIVPLNSINGLVSLMEEKCVDFEIIFKWYYVTYFNVVLCIFNRLDKEDAKFLPLCGVTETNEELLQ
jgi:hypothetical protein